MWVWRVVFCLGVLCLGMAPLSGFATSTQRSAPELDSILSTLKYSMPSAAPYVPICLPSVLPPHKQKLYPHVDLMRNDHAFVVTMYNNAKYQDHVSTLFWFSEQWNGANDVLPPGEGPKLTIASDTRPVNLRPGTWGYIEPVNGNDGPNISWWQRRLLLTFRGGANDAAMERVARSVACVQ